MLEFLRGGVINITWKNFGTISVIGGRGKKTKKDV